MTRWILGVGLVIVVAGLLGVSATRAEPVDPGSGEVTEHTNEVAAEPAEDGAATPPSDPAALAPPAEANERALNLELEVIAEHDPWEPFNETMFSFNLKLDRYALKPVAKGWDAVVPDPVQRSLKNAFDNLAFPRRLVNNLLQLKLGGAGREVGRFLLNTTVGVAGLFDVAKALGVEASDADTGQTLGIYGVGPGPYLVLPFLPPLTTRDGIGFAVDAALDPFSYVIFPVAALAGIGVGKRVDERALNLELYEGVEASTIDLYSAVRNAYLQKRQRAIEP